MNSGSKIQRLEDLYVWQKSKRLGREIYLHTNSGAISKDYHFRNQIRKAAISISSNIAEGFGRYNPGEFRNFLSIASGSTTEVKSQIYLAKEIGYITEIEADRLIQRCDEIARMIGGFRGKIKASNSSK